MFSKELENLIQATLEDGILEDYEKAALVKRAEAEGVDLAELEIYISTAFSKDKERISKRARCQAGNLRSKEKRGFWTHLS